MENSRHPRHRAGAVDVRSELIRERVPPSPIQQAGRLGDLGPDERRNLDRHRPREAVPRRAGSPGAVARRPGYAFEASGMTPADARDDASGASTSGGGRSKVIGSLGIQFHLRPAILGYREILDLPGRSSSGGDPAGPPTRVGSAQPRRHKCSRLEQWRLVAQPDRERRHFRQAYCSSNTR